MASQQVVKSRIKTVSSTRQITKAMQLVAASRLRKAQDSAIAPKRYVEEVRSLMMAVSSLPEVANNSLLAPRTSSVSLIVLVTSDRGLAGAYSANVTKRALQLIAQSGEKCKVISIGKIGSRFLSRIRGVNVQSAFEADANDLEREIVQPLLSEILDLYESHQVGEINVVYTSFESTIRQTVKVEKLLPAKLPERTNSNRTFEPSSSRVMDVVIKKYMESSLLQCVVESRASEYASRMLAMKNATDNASELIDDLKLVYNNARQSKITQELAEISGGAEALK